MPVFAIGFSVNVFEKEKKCVTTALCTDNTIANGKASFYLKGAHFMYVTA